MCELCSLQQLALAAKLRVYHFEPQLRCDQIRSDLLSVFATATLKHEKWDGCYNSSYILVLARDRNLAECQGITIETEARLCSTWSQEEGAQPQAWSNSKFPKGISSMRR